MKILFLRIGELPATDSRLLKETSSLSANGADVSVLGWVENSKKFLTVSKLAYNNQSIHLTTVGIKQSYGFKYLKIWAFLKFEIFLFFWLLIHADEYDAVHACNIHTGFIAAFWKGLKKFKLVYDIFDYAPDTRRYPRIYRRFVVWLENFAINTADHVIICSDERVKQLGKARPKQLSVIYNAPLKAAQTPRIKPQIGFKKSYKIAYVGGLTPYRCLPELLTVVQEHAELSLTIAGDGRYRKLFEEAARNNQRIHYLGIVPYSQVEQIEKESDIMVALYDPKIPNHYYASPNKFFEAMSLGKPLVMIHKSGMSMWLEKYQIGELAEPSPISLAQAIDRLIRRHSSWTDEAHKMQNVYQANFAWSLMDAKLNKIYSLN